MQALKPAAPQLTPQGVTCGRRAGRHARCFAAAQHVRRQHAARCDGAFQTAPDSVSPLRTAARLHRQHASAGCSRTLRALPLGCGGARRVRVTAVASVASSDAASNEARTVGSAAVALALCNICRVCMSVAVLPIAAQYGWQPAVQVRSRHVVVQTCHELSRQLPWRSAGACAVVVPVGLHCKPDPGTLRGGALGVCAVSNNHHEKRGACPLSRRRAACLRTASAARWSSLQPSRSSVSPRSPRRSHSRPWCVLACTAASVP